jgi:hypothetical protein
MVKKPWLHKLLSYTYLLPDAGPDPSVLSYDDNDGDDDDYEILLKPKS